MTVGRPFASTRDDIVRMGCFKCGGPQFHRNKKTGAVCTANKPKPVSENKLVSESPKPVDLVAKGLYNLQHAAPRSFASIVRGADTKVDFDSLMKKLDEVLAVQREIKILLTTQQAKTTTISSSIATLPVASPKSSISVLQPVHSPAVSATPVSQTVTESKIDDSKIQIQQTFIHPIPVVPDSKRISLVAKRRMAVEAPVVARDALATTSSSISSSSSSSIASAPFIPQASVLTPDQAKALFCGKRDSTVIDRPVSQRAAKRRRQDANKAARSAAADFF